MQKKSLIKGTLILSISGIIAKFLGFFFRIPLINMIGEEGIGLYQLTYPLYTFLLALSTGIPTAISKMISERLAVNRVKEAVGVFRVARYIMLIFGGISSLCIFIFSDRLIDIFEWNRDVYYSLLGIGLAPFFTSMLSVYRGYFQGFQYMTPPAISQVLEQITRVIIGVGLAFMLLPRGIDVAAGGASFGAVAGALIGWLFLLKTYSKSRVIYDKNQECATYIRIFKQIVKIAIPISISHAIGSVMTLIDSMLVPSLLRIAGYNYQMATILYGQLTGKAFVLINIPLTLSVSLSQCIVPAISEAYVLNNKSKLLRNINASLKLAIILSLPCCAGLYILAKPIMAFIFQGMYDGYELLKLLSIGTIFIIIAQACTGILNGIGRTILPIVAMVAGCVVKILVSNALIIMPSINIEGAAYGTILAYIVVAIIDIILVIKHIKLRINLMDTVIKPVICTIIMIFFVVITFTYMYNLTRKNSIAVLAAIGLGSIVYIIMLFITKTLDSDELHNILKSK